MLPYTKKAIGLVILSSVISFQAHAADRVNLGQQGLQLKFNADFQSLLANSGAEDQLNSYVVIPIRRPKPKPKVPIYFIQQFKNIEVYGVSALADIEEQSFTNISGQHIANI